MTNIVIRLSAVTKTYSSDLNRKAVALTGLSLEVQQGEVFGIIGPNGAGKSTTLKILLGIVQPDSGTVLLDHLPPSAPKSRERVGYLPETSCLYSNLSLIDHLNFAGNIAQYSKRVIKDRIDEMVSLVDMSDAATTQVRKYSKGMAQRAALAYALFHKPEIAILDEPMSGLDPLGRKLIIDIIKDYNMLGNTVLFCSHILTDVQKICDRIGIMKKGQLDTILHTSQLSNENELENIFISTVSE